MKNKHIIPQGWTRISLEEIAEVQTGLAKGKKDIVDPIERPYLRVANVQDGYLDLNELKVIRVPKKDLRRYSLRRGDVLMTEGGDFDKLGRGFVWEDQIEECLHQNHVFAVRPNIEKLDSYFLSYQAGSTYGKGYFLNCSKQSTNLASINSTQLKQFPVLWPSIEEQRSIVNVVDKWGRAISLTERLIAAKQEQRKGLMQQLLSGKRRFPGFTEPWREVRLGEIFKNRSETGYTHLPLAAITGADGVVLRDGLNRKDTSSADKSKYLRICPGDIGYNTMRMWQGVSGLSDIEGVVSPAYTIVTPCDSVDSGFMSLLFKFPYIVNLFYRYSQGLVSDTLNLKYSNFSQIKLEIPGQDEQVRIAGVFKPIDEEIVLLNQQLAALKEQKKGLMQQLLTGKVRVKVNKEAA